MRALNRKLIRDLKKTIGQAVAIAAVIAAGVCTFIMSTSTLDSLNATRNAYYQKYQFAEIFASLKRAPESLKQRIEDIPGVDKVQTRVVAHVKVDIPNFNDPVKGLITSYPNHGDPALNKLYLRKGRLLDSTRNNEVVINKTIADAHGLQPGDTLDVVIKGHLKKLVIVGIVLSPEYVYQIAPGSIVPDFKRYGVMWMPRRLLETSYEMSGAFNDVVLSLSKDASVDEVVDRLNLLLKPYGGIDSYSREWQVSHRFLNEEFKQLKQMSGIFSTIFLGVAAFLLNIVVKRLIDTQREQIAALKAFGYHNYEIAIHYIFYVLCVVILGLIIGIGFGVWLGKGLGNLYMEYYQFPFLEYQLHSDKIVIATIVTALAAIIGTIFSVKGAVSLAPAEAMRPEPPATYKETLIERWGLKKLLSQPNRMILRHIERKPIKAALSILGIAMACAIMLVGTFFKDAIDYMIDIEFNLSQRQDMTVTFVEPTSRRAVYDLIAMPGVEHGEVFRSVPVRLFYGHRDYRTSIQGYEEQRHLFRLLNEDLQEIELSKYGLVITDELAKMLEINVGDNMHVEVLEGRRPLLAIPVIALTKQYIGVGAYMTLPELNRLLKEGDAISGAYLSVDSKYQQTIYSEFKNMPRVANVDVRMNVINSFKKTVVDFMMTYITFISVLAGTITFAVIYNTARIALSERGRELASMRVLGFTRGEIAYILLGELGLLTLLAIPLGLLIGVGLCAYLVITFQHELFRIPLVIDLSTYVFAVLVVLIASILSGVVVRSRLNNLDLIAVLKTKE